MQDETFSLRSIKKVTVVSTHGSGQDCERRVNWLLNAGWTLLEIQKTDAFGELKGNNHIISYHLGHVDPQAETSEFKGEGPFSDISKAE